MRRVKRPLRDVRITWFQSRGQSTPNPQIHSERLAMAIVTNAKTPYPETHRVALQCNLRGSLALAVWMNNGPVRNGRSYFRPHPQSSPRLTRETSAGPNCEWLDEQDPCGSMVSRLAVSSQQSQCLIVPSSPPPSSFLSLWVLTEYNSGANPVIGLNVCDRYTQFVEFQWLNFIPCPRARISLWRLPHSLDPRIVVYTRPQRGWPQAMLTTIFVHTRNYPLRLQPVN